MNGLSRQTTKDVLIIVLLGAMVYVQYLCFKHYVAYCVAPCYPAHFDQLQYIDFSYRAVFTSNSNWWSNFLSGLERLNPMRGFVTPALSVLFVSVFGPSRLAVLSVNFVSFVIAEISLLLSFGKRSVLDRGLLACGLFQLCYYTHHVGSMTDLRLDYMAMMFMGMSYLLAVRWLRSGDKRALAAFAVVSILTTCTRSVTIFYQVAASIMMIVALCFAHRGSKQAAPYVKRAVYMFISLSLIFISYFSVFWRDFLQYYVRCKANGECTMAQEMMGTTNPFATAVFYAQSLAAHYLVPLVAGLLLMLVVFFKKGRKSGEKPFEFQDGDFVVIILCLTIVISVTSFASFFAPNSIVVGVAAVPVCYTMALIFQRIAYGKQFTSARVAAALLTLVTGMCLFVKETYAPLWCPAAHYKQATLLLADCQKELNQLPGHQTIFWCLPHDGLNALSFAIFAREHGDEALVARINQLEVPAFPEIKADLLTTDLNDCTFLVAPLEVPPFQRAYELDGDKTVRNNFALIRRYIAEHFILLTSRAVPELGTSDVSLKMGLYKRKSQG